VREDVQDQYGNTIYLTDERWRHIIRRHHQLDGHRDEVLSTVRSGHRKQDPLLLYKFYYTKAFPNLGRFREIEVVVVFRWKNNQPNNFIVTAYPN
jgi:hypothetical protein